MVFLDEQGNSDTRTTSGDTTAVIRIIMSSRKLSLSRALFRLLAVALQSTLARTDGPARVAYAQVASTDVFKARGRDNRGNMPSGPSSSRRDQSPLVSTLELAIFYD